MAKEQENISLSWFKTTVLESIDRAVNNQVKDIIKTECPTHDTIVPGHTVVSTEKVYAQLRVIGDVLTVVLKDGTILSKSNAGKPEFDAIRAAQSELEIFDIIATEEVVKQRKDDERQVAKLKVMKNGLKRLEHTKDFKIKDKHVYLKGTSRTIPTLLVEKFADVISKYDDVSKEDLKNVLEGDDEYQGLKRFFTWCCLNPRAEVADDLYDFLNRNSFRITKQGFFVALRNVVTVGDENKELVEFISNSYNKVKAVWKKNPDHYFVIQDFGANEYKLIKDSDLVNDGSGIGRLTTLYLNLPNMTENRYTDAHTRTFDIRVGQVVNMPMEECNWNTADCGHAGLHFTSDQIHYVGCGDTSMLILINPMKVVGIGSHKGRCYEYLPIMTVPRDEATQILHDGEFDTLQLDEAYAVEELESLFEKVQYGFTAEATKHTFNLPSISSKEVNKLILSLNEMTKVIDNRVNTIE